MTARRSAVLIGLVAAGVAVACGRELSAPDGMREPDTGTRPEDLALIAQNRNVCSIVVWSSDRADRQRSIRFRKTLPPYAPGDAGAGMTDEPSAQLARYGFRRFDGASGRLKVAVACVIPDTRDAASRTAGFFRTYDPFGSGTDLDAARKAGVRFSWGNGGDVYCDSVGGDLSCEGGVYCAMMERTAVNGPSFSRKGAPAASGNRTMTHVCDNGCDVYDWDYYDCGGDDGPVLVSGGPYEGPVVSLSCSTSSVIRVTQTVNCSASSSDGTDFKFSFESDDGLVVVQRDLDDVSSTWGGLLVVGGKITASVHTDSGWAASDPWHVSVTPRSGWTSLHPVYEVKNDSSAGLNPMPTAYEQLGSTDFTDVQVESDTATVSGGPNDHVTYMTSMHTQYLRVSVNYNVLREGSEFAGMQTGINGHCAQNYVAFDLKSHVEAHEGLAQQSNSHIGWFIYDFNSSSVGDVVEAMDGPSGFITNVMLANKVHAKVQASADYSHAFDPVAPPVPCTLTFYTQ